MATAKQTKPAAKAAAPAVKAAVKKVEAAAQKTVALAKSAEKLAVNAAPVKKASPAPSAKKTLPKHDQMVQQVGKTLQAAGASVIGGRAVTKGLVKPNPPVAKSSTADLAHAAKAPAKTAAPKPAQTKPSTPTKTLTQAAPKTGAPSKKGARPGVKSVVISKAAPRPAPTAAPRPSAQAVVQSHMHLDERARETALEGSRPSAAANNGSQPRTSWAGGGYGVPTNPIVPAGAESVKAEPPTAAVAPAVQHPSIPHGMTALASSASPVAAVPAAASPSGEVITGAPAVAATHSRFTHGITRLAAETAAEAPVATEAPSVASPFAAAERLARQGGVRPGEVTTQPTVRAPVTGAQSAIGAPTGMTATTPALLERRYEVFPDGMGNYRWRLVKAANGEEVARSQYSWGTPGEAHANADNEARLHKPGTVSVIRLSYNPTSGVRL